MGTETSNIDDLLMGSKTPSQPETPENPPDMSYLDDEPLSEETVYDEPKEPIEEDGEEQEPLAADSLDEYGNEPEPENKGIRDRLKRQAERHQAEIESLRQQLTANQPHQVQKAAEEFEYNPNESGDWQAQLRDFVKQTVKGIGAEEQAIQQRHQEEQASRQFQDKFRQGMDRFDDFSDVVGEQPFTDYMTHALRGVNDPAAFVYAASKRHSKDLERISRLSDPYAQIVEMGRLEERMRKNAGTTSAPRPISPNKEDSGMRHKEKKGDPSIEDMIRDSEARKMAKMRARRA